MEVLSGCSAASRSSAVRTVSSVAGPPTSSAAAARISSVIRSRLASARAKHLRGGELGVQRVPEPRLPAAGGPAGGRARPGRRAGPRSQSANSSSAPTASPARPARPRRRSPGASASSAGQLVPDQRRRAGELPDRGLHVDPGHVAEHRAGGGQRVRHVGEPAGEARQPHLDRGERPGDQRVQQRRRGCAAAGSTRASRTSVSSNSSRSTRAVSMRVVDLLRPGRARRSSTWDSASAASRSIATWVCTAAVGQVRQPVVEPVVAGRGGQRGTALQQRVDDALGEWHESRHGLQPRRVRSSSADQAGQDPTRGRARSGGLAGVAEHQPGRAARVPAGLRRAAPAPSPARRARARPAPRRRRPAGSSTTRCRPAATPEHPGRRQVPSRARRPARPGAAGAPGGPGAGGGRSHRVASRSAKASCSSTGPPMVGRGLGGEHRRPRRSGGTASQPSRSAGASALLAEPMCATRSGASPCRQPTGSRSYRNSAS